MDKNSELKKETPEFGLRDKIGYALGDFGCNLSFSLISTYMYIFYTQYIGITTVAWAAIILAVKIWDAINDPLMGGIMDSVKIRKGGKFKPWIKIGSFGLILAGALVFLPLPNAPMGVKIAVCSITYLIWDICYTIVNVPYGAFNAAISAAPAHRASLSTFRSIGGGLGGALCMLLPVLVFDKDDVLLGGRMFWIGAIMGIIAFFSFRFMLKMTTERVEITRTEQKFNYFKTIKGFVKNRSAMAVSIASFALIVFFLSTSITNALIFQSYFHNAKLLATASILSYLPLVVTIPFVGKIVAKFGKKLAAGVPLALSTVMCIVMLLIPLNPEKASAPWIYIVGMMFIQLGGGIFQLVCWAMVADCIDYQHIMTGRRDEGSIYAIYSLFRKLAQGVCGSLIPLTMVWVGYNEALGPNQPAEIAEKMKNMSLFLILAGSLLMACAILLLYKLGKKEVAEINEKLGKITSEININEALGNARE